MASSDGRKEAQQRHFRRRVRERLGYDLTEAEVALIKRNIEEGAIVGEPSQIPRLVVYKIFIDSRPCVVLFDIVTEELVTFLTLSMWQEREMKNNASQSFRVTFEQSPVGEVLKKLREKL